LGITKHTDVGTWSSLPHSFELKKEPGFYDWLEEGLNKMNKKEESGHHEKANP